MPVTRMQSERIEILLQLLRKRHTSVDLLNILNRMMRERYDDYVEISSRTLANDIAYIRSRYNAEIHRPNKTDKDYYFEQQLQLSNQSVSDEDIEILTQAQTILQSIHGMSLGSDMKRIFSRLYSMQTGAESEQIIAFENHYLADGTEYIDNLMQAIMNKKVLKVTYSALTDNKRSEFDFSPYFLKEYRGRWFVFGFNHTEGKIYNLILSGIEKIKNEFKVAYEPNSRFKPSDYFEYLIGVTVREGQLPEEIEVKVLKQSARYVTTKKLIANQEIIKTYANGDIKIRFKAYINYELKQNLLGFGDAVCVLKPLKLAEEMRLTYEKALSLY